MSQMGGAAMRQDDDTTALSEAEDACIGELAQGLELKDLSDGRLWDDGLVADEVHSFLRQQMRCVYEIGRRLLWAREVKSSGGFAAWCREHVGFLGERTIRNYMNAAAFLQSQPRLIQHAQELGLKKTLLLAQVPDHEIEKLLSDSEPELNLEQMKLLPYPELKMRLRDAERELAELKRTANDEGIRATKAERTITDLSSLRHGQDDGPALETLASVKGKLEAGLKEVGLRLDILAMRNHEGKLSPRVRSEMVALVEWLATWADYERLHLIRELGGDVLDYQIEDVLTRPRPGGERYEVPDRGGAVAPEQLEPKAGRDRLRLEKGGAGS